MSDINSEEEETIDTEYEEAYVNKPERDQRKRFNWSRVALFLLPLVVAGVVFFFMTEEEKTPPLQGKPALLERMAEERETPKEAAKNPEPEPETAVDTDIAMSPPDATADEQALERFFEEEETPEQQDEAVAQPEEEIEAAPTASTPATPDSAAQLAGDWQQAFTTQQQQIAALQQQLGEMQQEMHKEQQRATEAKQLLLQFSFLKAHVLEAKPFKSELRLLMQAEAIPEEVKTQLDYFVPYAAEGIPSLEVLQQEFDETLTAYYQQDADEAETALAKAGNWFSSLVTVRKVGSEHKGGTDEDVLARAEHWLEQGNVGRALKELRALSVQASPHFKAWRAEAYSYKHARDLLPEIEQRLFNSL